MSVFKAIAAWVVFTVFFIVGCICAIECGVDISHNEPVKALAYLMTMWVLSRVLNNILELFE